MDHLCMCVYVFIQRTWVRYKIYEGMAPLQTLSIMLKMFYPVIIRRWRYIAIEELIAAMVKVVQFRQQRLGHHDHRFRQQLPRKDHHKHKHLLRLWLRLTLHIHATWNWQIRRFLRAKKRTIKLAMTRDMDRNGKEKVKWHKEKPQQNKKKETLKMSSHLIACLPPPVVIEPAVIFLARFSSSTSRSCPWYCNRTSSNPDSARY